MRITEFKGNMKDGARPNLFHVELSFPGFAGSNKEDEKLKFTCKAAQLPASTVGMIEVPYLGRTIKVPGDRTFAEWTLTVINDTDFKVRDAFERWMNAINAHVNNTGLSFQQLTRDCRVHQLDRQGKKIKTYRMSDAFPTEVSAIDLAWDSNDQVEEFTVTLQIQYWTSETTS